jgi:hypothetical protein
MQADAGLCGKYRQPPGAPIHFPVKISVKKLGDIVPRVHQLFTFQTGDLGLNNDIYH